MRLPNFVKNRFSINRTSVIKFLPILLWITLMFLTVVIGLADPQGPPPDPPGGDGH